MEAHNLEIQFLDYIVKVALIMLKHKNHKKGGVMWRYRTNSQKKPPG